MFILDCARCRMTELTVEVKLGRGWGGARQGWEGAQGATEEAGHVSIWNRPCKAQAQIKPLWMQGAILVSLLLGRR